MHLIVGYIQRPWWGLGLIKRRKYLRLDPSPDQTRDDIAQTVRDLRAAGAKVIYQDD